LILSPQRDAWNEEFSDPEQMYALKLHSPQIGMWRLELAVLWR